MVSPAVMGASAVCNLTSFQDELNIKGELLALQALKQLFQVFEINSLWYKVC